MCVGGGEVTEIIKLVIKKATNNNRKKKSLLTNDCTFRKINLYGDGLHILKHHLLEKQRHMSILFLSNNYFMQNYCIIFFISNLCAMDFMIYSNSTLTFQFTHDLMVYQANHLQSLSFFLLKYRGINCSAF